MTNVEIQFIRKNKMWKTELFIKSLTFFQISILHYTTLSEQTSTRILIYENHEEIKSKSDTSILFDIYNIKVLIILVTIFEQL